MSKQKKESNNPQIKITLVKSLIGRIEKHKATVRCLGLRRINQSCFIKANDMMRGMVRSVSYLLKVEEV